jgi:hypothetical protein
MKNWILHVLVFGRETWYLELKEEHSLKAVPYLRWLVVVFPSRGPGCNLRLGLCRICGGQIGTGAGLRFPPSVLTSPTAPHSSAILSSTLSSLGTNSVDKQPTYRNIDWGCLSTDAEGILSTQTKERKRRIEIIIVQRASSLCRVWGSHGGGHEEYYLLGYNAV